MLTVNVKQQRNNNKQMIIVLHYFPVLSFIWTALVALSYSSSMVRTRFAPILYFGMVAIRLHVILCRRHFEVNEDMVHILLMLEYFSLRILKQKICSVVILLALSPACSSPVISAAWGLSLFMLTVRMTLLE